MGKVINPSEILIFDVFGNNRQFDFAKDQMNKAHSMLFLAVGVHENGIDFSIITQLQEADLKQLLEKLIRSLPDGKAIISPVGF